MIPEEQLVVDTLAAAVAQLDEVLNPWGFSFEANETHYSHRGYYASGNYCRGMTRIYISSQAKINRVSYEHSLIKEFVWHKESHKYGLGHHGLMAALGHADDCHLITGGEYAIVARDDGDRVAALIHDLRHIAAPVLREPCDEFLSIIRTGYHSWTYV
jgi:hypothetical protein